jgi:hypothetical protein
MAPNNVQSDSATLAVSPATVGSVVLLGSFFLPWIHIFGSGVGGHQLREIWSVGPYRFYVEPVVVQLWEMLAVLTTLGLLFVGSAKYIGPFLGPFLLFVLAGVFVWLMRNAIGMGLRDLDDTLLKIPAIGPIYERFCRKDSYYRQDLRDAYCSIVSSIVKGEVETVTAAKGVKLIREFSYSPFFGDQDTGNDTKPKVRAPVTPEA